MNLTATQAPATTTAEVLTDKTATGRERPWRVHRLGNQVLSLVYEDVDPHKAERLRGCANHLFYKPSPDGSTAHGSLVRADFCRVRLCPMCTWRRSLKTAAQMREVMAAIAAYEDKPKDYIMLTVTVRNVTGEELSGTLDSMLAGFNRMMQRKEVKTANHGYFRGLEITHNVDWGSKDYDTYHPHMHIILCVNKSYFTGRTYIKQDRWTELWRESARLDYTPIVHVQKLYGKREKAIAEAAKYAVKPGDYIIPDDWDLSIDAVRWLDAALHNRRLIGMGGIIAEYHKRLHLDDAEDGDLVHVETEDKPTTEDGEHLIHYAWFSGYRQYYRVEV